MPQSSLLFLAWECPWPAHSGAGLRTMGLLRELSQAFQIELIVLARRPLSELQKQELGRYAQTIRQVPMRDQSRTDRLRALALSATRALPYHSAVLQGSLAYEPEVLHAILRFPGVVFTSLGHWGSLIADRPAPNWVLNQCDADVEFWRAYAALANSYAARQAARANFLLARAYFPRIYRNVSRIIAVCPEDRQHTQALAPATTVDVIENGIDCAFYTSQRAAATGRQRLLFTGTSAARNMRALHSFVRDTLPLIQRRVPAVELLVAGNFRPEAQAEFKGCPTVRFTGRVDDIRPFFDQSDLFIAPFQESHGSKLKVAEAMAMGMAVVATPQGARGLPISPGESAVIAEHGAAFAEQVVGLLGSSEERERLGAAARRVALERLDWPVLGRRLRALVQATSDGLALPSVHNRAAWPLP